MGHGSAKFGPASVLVGGDLGAYDPEDEVVFEREGKEGPVDEEKRASALRTLENDSLEIVAER